MSDLVKRYTASVFFDKRLWQADIAGSLAHAEMLCHQGILSAADQAAIARGMAQTSAEIEALGDEVRQRVKAKSGIDLHWEIQRVGETK